MTDDLIGRLRWLSKRRVFTQLSVPMLECIAEAADALEALRPTDSEIMRAAHRDSVTIRATLAASPTIPDDIKSGGVEELPPDVVRLVIAARLVAWEDADPEKLKELQEASEAFAARVPWEDEPEEVE